MCFINKCNRTFTICCCYKCRSLYFSIKSCYICYNCNIFWSNNSSSLKNMYYICTVNSQREKDVAGDIVHSVRIALRCVPHLRSEVFLFLYSSYQVLNLGFSITSTENDVIKNNSGFTSRIIIKNDLASYQ